MHSLVNLQNGKPFKSKTFEKNVVEKSASGCVCNSPFITVSAHNFQKTVRFRTDKHLARNFDAQRVTVALKITSGRPDTVT